MANMSHQGEMALEKDRIRTAPTAPKDREIMIKPNGMCWMGRVFIEGEGYIWIPLPFTTLADTQTVMEGLREKGYIPILDQ